MCLDGGVAVASKLSLNKVKLPVSPVLQERSSSLPSAPALRALPQEAIVDN